MDSGSELPKGGVRQGGKEELRASLLKTYLLRIRSEKGEREVRTILATAGIDPAMVDNETGWISTLAAKTRAPRHRRAPRDGRAPPARRVGHERRGARCARAHAPLRRAAHRRLRVPRRERARGHARRHVGARGPLRGGQEDASEKKSAEGSSAKSGPASIAPPSRDIEGKSKRTRAEKAKVRAVRLVYRPRTDGYDEPEKVDVRDRGRSSARRVRASSPASRASGASPTHA